MPTKKLFLTLCFLVYTINISAQVSSGGTPLSFLSSNLNKNTLPEIKMSSFDLEAMLEEDKLYYSQKGQMYRFGKEFDVEINLQNSGKWTDLPNGDRVWRLKISSKNAKSINLVYNQYFLPKGAQLFLYNEEKTATLGAFTNKNNKPTQEFCTGLIKGNHTILEYFEPKNVKNEGKISISKVVHAYRDFYNKDEKEFGDSGSCNNNVNCPEGADWKDQISSVCLLLQGGFRFCTGAMINNVEEDCTPYMLTADHCIGGISSGAFVNWMFMFNYQSPTCANQDGFTNQTVSGATLRANLGASDFALFELSEEIPVEYDIYFSGFDAEDTPAPKVTGIHHPAGDIKKISFDEDPVISTGGLSGVPNSHWEVSQWTDGTTEGGSSGSPLYDESKRVIGQLHGGSASCSSLTYDAYGKIAYSWDTGNTPQTRLRDWLDPNGTGRTFVDGRSCALPDIALDASVASVMIPNEICTSTSDFVIEITNLGAETITEMDVLWSLGVFENLTTIWEGELHYNQTAEVLLVENAPFNIGTTTATVQIITINNNNDQIPENNILVYSIERIDGESIEIDLNTDNEANETSFEIRNENDGVLFTENDFNNNSANNFNYCLNNGCYQFVIFDSGNNGICCGSGNGNYEIFNAEGENVASGGDFGESETIEFCVGEKPVEAVLTSSTQSVCTGSTIQFNNESTGEPTIVTWTFEGGEPTTSIENNPTITYNTAGTYNVSLEVSNNSSSQITETTITVTEIGDFNINTTATLLGQNTGAATFNTENWVQPVSFILNNENVSDLQNLGAGTYNLIVRDGNGCEATKSFTVSVDLNNEYGVAIYPNPVFGQNLNIYNENTIETQIGIFGINGQQVGKWILQEGFNNLKIGEKVAAGVYVVIIEVGGEKYVEEVMFLDE